MADGKVLGLDMNDSSMRWSVAISVLLIVLGVFALFAPFFAGVVLVTVIAWVLMIVGCVHLWSAWHTRGKRSELWEALIGVVYLGAGIFLLERPLVGLVTLTLVLAVYLLLKGILELGRALRLRPKPGTGWMFLDAVVSLLLGVAIGWHLLSNSTWVIGVLLGIAILFSGVARLAVTLITHKPVAGLA